MFEAITIGGSFDYTVRISPPRCLLICPSRMDMSETYFPLLIYLFNYKQEVSCDHFRSHVASRGSENFPSLATSTFSNPKREVLIIPRL